MALGKDIQTTFPYLARSTLYKEEKPFATDFIPDVSNVELTNHIFDFIDLVVIDARPSRNSFTLDQHGFCFLKSQTLLTDSNADDISWVEEKYYAEIERVLHDAFPEYSRLECLDHQVSTLPPSTCKRPLKGPSRLGGEANCFPKAQGSL